MGPPKSSKTMQTSGILVVLVSFDTDRLVVVVAVPFVTTTVCLKSSLMSVCFGTDRLVVVVVGPFVTMTMIHACLVLKSPLLVIVSFGPMLHMDREVFLL